MVIKSSDRGLTESPPAAPRDSALTESLPACGLTVSLPASGLYVLLLQLNNPVTIRVGALGEWEFPKGWYAYAGSARRGLTKRVARHMAREKPLRWHIDHLTKALGAEPLGAVLLPAVDSLAASAGGLSAGFSERTLSECEVNRRVGGLIDGSAPVPRFGASDCRARCPAHLWHSARAITPKALAGQFPGAAYMRA